MQRAGSRRRPGHAVNTQSPLSYDTGVSHGCKVAKGCTGKPAKTAARSLAFHFGRLEQPACLHLANVLELALGACMMIALHVYMQGAMLHARGPRVDPARISRALQVLQTSSPSYLLMASLDAARLEATVRGILQPS